MTRAAAIADQGMNRVGMGQRTKRVVTKMYLLWEDAGYRRQLAKLRASIDARLFPADFWYGRYPHTFIERQPPTDLGGPSELPRRIWMVWSGPNPMSAARRAGLERIRALNRDIELVLVTPDNLDDFIVAGHPLHPAYRFLSYTHRSDYLRAYLLHHHGGAYSDIKPMLTGWSGHFDAVERCGAWALGPALPSTYETGRIKGKLGGHLQRYYASLLSGSAMVARSHTQLTAEWMREVDRQMTYLAPALEECPHDENGDGEHAGYPLFWMDLLGNILQPLLLKYGEHVRIDATPWWDQRADYR